MLRSLVPAVVSLAAAACSVDVQGEGSIVREEKRIQVAGVPDVTVRTFDGGVELRPWDRDEILLEIEKRANTETEARDLAVDVRQMDNHVTIEARAQGRARNSNPFGKWTARSVRLRLTVPRRANIEARSGDGSILARDLIGRVDLRTGDGSVRVQNLQGEISVATGDGSVSANGLDGQLTVSTGDGSVELAGRFDALTARTGDGSMRIDAQPGSTAAREWTLTSGDGAVTLRLPPGFNANLDARTGDGAITADGLTLQSSGDVRERGVLRGRVGAGGETLLLRTGDGPITIVGRQAN